MATQHPDPAPATVFPAPLAVHRFTVEKYHEMIATSILREDDRVELLDGWIIDMSPIGILHRWVVEKTLFLLTGLLPRGWDAFAQQPVSLATSEPSPDVSVFRGDKFDYVDRHPGPSELVLVVEVADTSLKTDRNDKLPLYADAGILSYWIVNVADREVEVYRDPKPGSRPSEGQYHSSQRVSLDGELALTLDGDTIGRIAVADLFPPTEVQPG